MCVYVYYERAHEYVRAYAYTCITIIICTVCVRSTVLIAYNKDLFCSARIVSEPHDMSVVARYENAV
jgi:hypothetical protein